MQNKIKSYILIAILSLQPCNAMKKHKAIKDVAKLVTSGVTAILLFNELTDKYSDISCKNRSDIYNKCIKEHPKIDFYIDNANKALGQVLDENIRFFSCISPFIDKNFINKSLLDKKSNKSALSQVGIKAMNTIIQPTINNMIDRTKETIANTALIAGPAIGLALACKAKKIPKNYYAATRLVGKKIIYYGVGGGLAINATTSYIDNNSENIVNWGMYIYGQHESEALNELKAVCHNGLQMAKISLTNNKSLFRWLIKENPLQQTRFFIIDPQITQDAFTQYYTDIVDITIPKYLQYPVKILFPPLKINCDLFNCNNGDLIPFEDDNDEEESDQKKKKKTDTTQQSIKILTEL